MADETGNPVSVSDNPGTFVFDVQAASDTAGAATVESIKTQPFKVRPLHLVVQQPVGDVAQYQVLSGKIALVDSAGNVDTYDSVNGASLTLNGGSGTLQQNANLTFVSGVLDLSGAGQGVSSPFIDTTGSYTLTVGSTVSGQGTGSPATAAITTGSFTVSPLSVQFTTQPTSTTVNSPLAYNLQLTNASGAAVPKLGASLDYTLQLQPVSAGAAGALVGNGNQLFSLQGSPFQQSPVMVSAPGTYQLLITVQYEGATVTTVTSSSFTIS